MSEQKFPDGEAATEAEINRRRGLRHRITVSESQRQAIILALANLSMERPGWCTMLEEIALLMDNKRKDGRAEMFEDYRYIWTKPLVDKLTAQ